MSYLAIFSVSLLVELCSALYTIAVSHGNQRSAVIMSLISSALGLLTLSLLIEDVGLFPAVIAGDAIGTLAALKITKVGIRPRRRRMAGQIAIWLPTRRPGRQRLILTPANARMARTITDGYQTWSIECPTCHKNTMQVVRPGKVQCTKCG